MKKLDESNYILYAAQHYDNPQCHDVVEFYDDLARLKYLKRLFSKYKETRDLKERLVLNHLIVLYNVFGVEAATRLLFYKLYDYREYLKTFLIFLNYMPSVVYGVGPKGENIVSSNLPVDRNIAEKLRRI